MTSASEEDADFAVRSSRVITPEGVRDAIVSIREGRILAVIDSREAEQRARCQDLGNLVVSPGVIDIHVHVNQPGRTEWEGFQTATRAAVAGGVTTLVDMPLNSSPVTTTVEALQEKLAAAEGKCACDVGFYGGLIPGSSGEVASLIQAGVRGMKAFLCPSGLDDFPAATLSDLRAAMPPLAESQVPVLVHCELPHAPSAPVTDPRSYAQYRDSRPDIWEIDAIAQMIHLCREFHCPVHIVHLSSSKALPQIAAAKDEGLPLTVETCPHYLTFSSEEISDGATQYKCAPPIRSQANREALWEASKSGVIDSFGSDHSPCLPQMKQLASGDFSNAWGGIASLQWMLAATWTEARKRKVLLPQLAGWLSQAPARIVNLSKQKGRIEPGYDADLVVWDPDASFTVHRADILHRHPITPYVDRKLFGVVHRTYLRGKLVYEHPSLSVAVRPTGDRTTWDGRPLLADWEAEPRT